MATIHIGETVTIDGQPLPLDIGPFIQVSKIEGHDVVTVALIADDIAIDRDAIPAGTIVNIQG